MVIDSPQIEDHAAIARSAMQAADEIVMPVAPIADRDSPVGADAGRGGQGRLGGPRVRPAEPLHRQREQHRGRARSADDLGYDVLSYTVPRLELYAQSFGGPVPPGDPVFWCIARELLDRAKETAR